MLKGIGQLASGNLFSKLLGFAREVITAASFGTNEIIGAYRVAQTGALVPIHFFTSDSLNAAFIPLYTRYRSSAPDKAQTLFWVLAAIFVFLSLLISSAFWLVSNHWLSLIAPGLSKATAGMAAGMLQVLAVGVPMYLASALLMFLAVANRDFIPAAARPSIQNLGLIAGVLLAFKFGRPALLAWSFTTSYTLYLIWLISRLSGKGFLNLPSTWAWPNMLEVCSAFWQTLRPLLLLPLFLQGNIIVERAVASLIGIAAVSGIDYAKLLTETLIVLVSLPIGLVGLAHWSNLDDQRFDAQIRSSLLIILLIGAPASGFIFANAPLIITVMYARGVFDASSIQMTTQILSGIAIGLWAQMLGYVLVKALNARSRNRAVFIIMTLALCGNAVINWELYSYLGALTLGLGNSAYGIILLAGTLTSLRLWRTVSIHFITMSFAICGYIWINSILVPISDLWLTFGVAVFVATAYWSIWIVLIPAWRREIRFTISSLLAHLT